jgi:hypothetical protein
MKFVTTICFIACVASLIAQETPTSRLMQDPIQEPDAKDRYGIDYELKDYSFQHGDSTILFQLDLDGLESFRNPNMDVEVIDPNTGLVVILFHELRKPNRSTTINSTEQ